jgi:hypothetical protein
MTGREGRAECPAGVGISRCMSLCPLQRIVGEGAWDGV